MNDQAVFWSKVIAGPLSETLLQAAMYHTACNLSEMMGRTVTIDVVQVEAVPIGQVMTHIGSPEEKTAGVYLLIEGDLHGQAVLMLPIADALHMVDLLMAVPPDTTTGLGDLERSALAEVGNVTVASFLNEVATFTGLLARPSPPVIIVDMLGAILNVVITPVAATGDDLLIVETVFKETERVVRAHFWVLPEPAVVTFGDVSIHPVTRANRD
jgi:chemotaxis protein CheC